MIRIFLGDNNYEKERSVAKLISDTDAQVEKYDGANLSIKDLPDILMGATLFADKRLIIVKNLSENSSVWSALSAFLDNLPQDLDLILVEAKLDKRASTYKKLIEVANIQEFNNLDERDHSGAIRWLQKEAESHGLSLDSKIAGLVVGRVGVDQMNLSHALEKLLLMSEITTESVEMIIDASPSENVFNLLETAVKGDKARVAEMLSNMRSSEDPARLLGLISGQAFQLLAISSASSSDKVASDFGIHPYVVSKLSSLAKSLSKTQVKRLVNILAETDDNLKISKGDPWLNLEIALQKIASL